jgi:TolA-binding protein
MMDCEEFEAAMRAAVDGELDEATSSAMSRHASGCPRCATALGRPRETRPASSAPLSADPLPNPERRILQAALAQAALATGSGAKRTASLPFGGRLAVAVSVAGNWAMRPQTAMAALFLVMIATSVLLLRGKSSRAPASAEITVTEEGTPAPTTPAGAARSSTLPAAPPDPSASTQPNPRDSDGRSGAPAAVPIVTRSLDDVDPRPPAKPSGSGRDHPAGTTAFDEALGAYQAGHFDEARRAFDALPSTNANAKLWAARSLREGRGCEASVSRFDDVARVAPNTPAGWNALVEGARCYESLGDTASARARLDKLAGIASFKDLARAELDRIAHGQNGPEGR